MPDILDTFIIILCQPTIGSNVLLIFTSITSQFGRLTPLFTVGARFWSPYKPLINILPGGFRGPSTVPS